MHIEGHKHCSMHYFGVKTLSETPFSPPLMKPGYGARYFALEEGLKIFTFGSPYVPSTPTPARGGSVEFHGDSTCVSELCRAPGCQGTFLSGVTRILQGDFRLNETGAPEALSKLLQTVLTPFGTPLFEHFTTWASDPVHSHALSASPRRCATFATSLW